MKTILLVGTVFLVLFLPLASSISSVVYPQVCSSQSLEGTKGTFGSACDGSYPANCSSGDRLSCNDGLIESHGANIGLYGGVQITSYNESLSCEAISEVSVCYEWWEGLGVLTSDCDISVDNDNGSSFTALTTACPASVANPGVTCANVSGLDNWECSNFFGGTGVRAQIKSEAATLVALGSINWDVLYFNITYEEPMPPSVFGLFPNVTTPIFSSIELYVNVTDNVAVDSVLANISLPNGSSELVTLNNSLGSKYNVSYSITGLLGRYNITILANDTSGNNNNSQTTYFVAEDVSPPNVTSLSPQGQMYNLTQNVRIAANVTDQITVDTVLANISYPNGSSTLLTLINFGSTYNNTFTVPNIIGIFNVTFIANDSSGNNNDSTVVNFTAKDPTNPVVTALSPTGQSYGQGTNATIQANVTDTVAVDTVLANITYPNGSSTLLTLTNAVGAVYNANFTLPGSLTGTYNFTVIANDTSNNLNNSETSTFEGTESVAPTVVSPSPLSQSYNSSDNITIEVNVTDASGVDAVLANISYPNGSTMQLTLTNTSADIYNNTFIVPNLTGLFNITFIANDTFGNDNSTVLGNFTSVDTVNPVVTGLLPATGSSANSSENITVQANVTDNVGLSSVVVNISYPNGTIVQLAMTNTVGNIYQVNFTVPNSIGVYNITVIANDTSGNSNNSVLGNFTAIDSVPPSIGAVTPISGSSVNTSQTFLLQANVTDNVAIGSVLATVFYPNGTTTQLNLTSFGDVYNVTITVPNLTGVYNITIAANDTSNNTNTVDLNISAIDLLPPQIVNITPFNQTFNATQTITISAFVTDNIQVEAVNSTITFPNSSTEIVLFSLNGSEATANFTIPNLDGQYNFSIFANDTNGNSNSSQSFFSAQIITLENLSVNPSLPFVNNGSRQTLSINFSTVTYPLNITLSFIYPNGTIATETVAVNNNSFVPINYTLVTGLVNGNFSLNLTVDSEDQGSATMNLGWLEVNDTTLPTISSLVSTPSLPFTNNGSEQNISIDFQSDEYPLTISFNLFNDSNVLIDNSSITKNTNGSVNYTLPSGLVPGNYSINISFKDVNNNNITIALGAFSSNDSSSPELNNISSPLTAGLVKDANELNITINFSSNEFPIEIFFILFNTTTATISGPVAVNTSNQLPLNYTIPSNISNGSYSLNITVSDSLGNNQSYFLGSFQVITNLTIYDYDIQPKAVINGSSSFFYVHLLNFNISYANISHPNGSIQTISLNNKANTSFNSTNLVGRYNVTFYAENTTNGSIVRATATEYFEVFPSLNFSDPMANNSINASWNALYRNSVVGSGGGSNTSTQEVVDTTVTLDAQAYNQQVTATLKGVNLSRENNKTINIDRHNAISEFVITYGVESNYSFENATLVISYEGTNYTDEDDFVLQKCADYNFSGRECLGSFDTLSANITHNKSNKSFTVITNSFSAFSIKENIPSSNGGSSSSGSSGSGGGGSGGGFSAPAQKEDECIENCSSTQQNYDAPFTLEFQTSTVEKTGASIEFNCVEPTTLVIEATLRSQDKEITVDKKEVICDQNYVLDLDTASLEPGAYDLLLKAESGEYIKTSIAKNFLTIPQEVESTEEETIVTESEEVPEESVLSLNTWVSSLILLAIILILLVMIRGKSSSKNRKPKIGNLLTGEIYLVEKKYLRSFQKFSSDRAGLAFVRDNPKKYKSTHIKYIWLTEKQGENYIEPSDIETIYDEIKKFTEKETKGAFYIQGIDYLISGTNFKTILRTLRLIKDLISNTENIGFIELNSQSLDENQYKKLEAELKEAK